MLAAIIKCILFTPLAYLLRFAAIVLAPVAVVFISDDGRLPWIFRWMETHDNVGWSGPMSVEATRTKTEKYGRRIGMIFWLWRNKAYTAQYTLFSIPYQTEQLTTRTVYQSGTTEVPTRGLSYSFTIIEVEGKKYFEFQPRLSLGSFVVYLRTGWKVQDIPARLEQGLNPVGSQGMFTGFTLRSDGT